MGAEISREALKLFAADLYRLIPNDEDIKRGLKRTRREVRAKGGPPRLLLQDVLDRCGVISEADAQQLDAEQAFEETRSLAARFAQTTAEGEVVLRRKTSPPDPGCTHCAGQGMYYPDPEVHRVVRCGCRRVEELPTIDPRILEVVEALGGWATFADIAPSRFPFVKRDFLAEFLKLEKAHKFRMLEKPPGAVRGPELAVRGQVTSMHRLEGTLSRILNSPVR